MLKADYQAALSCLRKNRWLFLGVAVGFFTITFLSGIIFYLAFSQNPSLLEEMMSWVNELLGSKEIIDEYGKMNVFRLFLANFMAVTHSILLGLLPFFYLPVLALLLNAVLIGVVGAAALLLGMPPMALVASLVPHGIFELPALILGAGIGLRLCHSLVRRMLRRPEPKFTVLVCDLVRVLVLVVIPLLIAAAIIESYVTGPIASLFL